MATIDTTTGTTTPTGQNITDITGTGAASGGTPYDQFNTNISNMLTQLQAANQTGNTKLAQGSNALESQGVMGAGAGSNYAGADTNSEVAGNAGFQTAFGPAEASINQQQANNQATLGSITNFADTQLSNLKGQYTQFYNQAAGKMQSINTNTGVITDVPQSDPATVTKLSAPGSSTWASALSA